MPDRRRRRCRSPKVDGGRLQKAAPEASLASEKDLLLSHHVSSRKTSNKCTQSSMRCVCMAIYIGPHLLYANTQGGSPSPHPARSGGGNRPLGSAAGPVLEFLKIRKTQTFKVKIYMTTNIRSIQPQEAHTKICGTIHSCPSYITNVFYWFYEFLLS